MCHHTLKCVVCNRHLFLGCAQKHSEVFGATKFHENFDGMKIFSKRFSAQKMQCIFLCSEIKTSYLPHPKGYGLISDINKN